MKTFFLFIVAALLSCRSASNTPQGPERTEAAFLYDGTGIADGCEDHVRLYTTGSSATVIQYKPTSATLPLLVLALAQIPASTNSTERAVTIRFTETGRQVPLQCGWVSPTVAEIAILSIVKR